MPNHIIKQGPGKIDWCDGSFNPISGRCLHNCSYCYMHRFWRFPGNDEFKFKAHYLETSLPKKPSKIFIGSSTDMWGEWVPELYILKVLRFVEANPQHIFQFLTKNPRRYGDFKLPKNGWYGTTVDGSYKTKENGFDLLTTLPNDLIRFISFEPLLAPPPDTSFIFVDWIIIGANSKHGAAKPPASWANNVISAADAFRIPVWVKDNYNYHKIIKEFPNEL